MLPVLPGVRSAGGAEPILIGDALPRGRRPLILVTGPGPELLGNPDVRRTLLDLGREASA